MSEYNHTEQPDNQLQERRQELGKLLTTIPHGALRREQLGNELSYIIFEEMERIKLIPIEDIAQ